MQNRTADLLLTMETLYRLSYRGQSTFKATKPRNSSPNPRYLAMLSLRETSPHPVVLRGTSWLRRMTGNRAPQDDGAAVERQPEQHQSATCCYFVITDHRKLNQPALCSQRKEYP